MHHVIVVLLGLSCLCAQQVPESLSAADWTGIRAAHDAARRAVVAVESGHEAENRTQHWSVRFDGRGMTVLPDAGDWTWGLELVSFGRGGSERGAVCPAEVTAAGTRLTYRWSGGVDEWYVNGTGGLEHGYTVRERLAGDGDLTFRLRVRGGLTAVVDAAGRDVAFGSAQAKVLTYAGLTVSDADGRVLPAHFTVLDEGLLLSIDERGARYPVTIDPMVQQAYLKASNTDIADAFGFATAVSGDTVVVGAWGESSNATGVNGNQSDNSATYAGAAYVFVRSGGGWSQQAYLKASNADAGDRFGWSVGVSGDTIVVGAYGESSAATGVNGNQSDNSIVYAGAAYVFVRAGGSWSQQAYLKASNTDGVDFFGRAVAVSGDTIVVGADGEDSNATVVNGNAADNSAADAGAAYVFVRSPAGVWSQQAYLKASNTGTGDQFGRSVAVSADTVVVGAYTEDSSATGVNGNGADNSALESGAAYVFARTAGTWTQQAYLKASNTEAADRFAWSVAASGETVVVGAYGEDSNATGVNGNQANNSAFSAGAAYVFVRNAGSWSQQAYLKASNTGAGDEFGWSVAVSRDTVVVGADAEDSDAVGVNGSGTDSAIDAGAAYVFARGGTTWSEQAYLKASNTGVVDKFGFSVAVAAGTVVVGASNESSSATGVNGNQADDSASAAGATYVFDVRSGCVGSNGRPWVQATSEPRIGLTHTLVAGNLNPAFNFAALVFGFVQFPLPGLDLGPILAMPGCDAYQTADVLVNMPIGAGGTASWSWTVVGAPGDTFWCQALCFDPGVNGFGFTLSNQLETVLVN